MKRIWFRKLLGGLSFTSALFVFQACYGTGPDFGPDVYIEGQVKSQSTGIPIPGIKVSLPEMMQYEYTNEEGRFSLYIQRSDNYNIKFEDTDSIQNGFFANKDTLLTKIADSIYLDIKLNPI